MFLPMFDQIVRFFQSHFRQRDQRCHLGLHALPVPLGVFGLQCLKDGLQFLAILQILNEKRRKLLKKNCTRETIVFNMCLHDGKSLGRPFENAEMKAKPVPSTGLFFFICRIEIMGKLILLQLTFGDNADPR